MWLGTITIGNGGKGIRLRYFARFTKAGQPKQAWSPCCRHLIGNSSQAMRGSTTINVPGLLGNAGRAKDTGSAVTRDTTLRTTRDNR